MEYKKETVTVMMTAFGIWNVEQEIAKTKILCRIFQLVQTAAMTLFQVRYCNQISRWKRLKVLAFEILEACRCPIASF